VSLLEDLRERLHGETGTGYTWSNAAGDRYAAHLHPYDKVLYCVEGSITFVLDDGTREVQLQPGDRLELPAGIPHSATVGPEGCVCIEGHREARG
jgi:quercetin dioxygenase-like cupin family protein